ncbi:MAG: DUF4251 domain-containing protein [Bacteroidales bacterium]|jgi:hypothetical protein|nr:DUF4251 domain-containing protein [Bacteroidales bacterium]
MKKIAVFVLMLSIVAGGEVLYGQEKKSKKQRKAEQIEMKTKQLIDTQKYIFKGKNVRAIGTAFHNIEYYLIVTDKVIETSFLPQYSKKTNLVTGPISFYDDFEYKVENSEKGGWEIFIKIELNKMGDSVEMFLVVYPDGQAKLTVYQLTVTGFRGAPWECKGYIEGPKPNGNF